MMHRGPDASGDIYYKVNDKFVGLGHNRLSIIDLSTSSNQPFLFENKFIIVYNGEIYNYKELGDFLESKGYIFKTSSDTEVLLASYDYYRNDVFNYLDGMFAFSIYDIKEKRMIIARDHLGIKPVYYYFNQKNDEFYFSSELKSLFKFLNIPKLISKNAITEYLFNGWLYEPDTGYQDIFKVPPGAYLEYYIESNHLTKKTFFDILDKNSFSKELENISIAEIVNDSISKHCRSDVQLGSYFSGGVDSTIIASSDRSIHCISAKYSKRSLEHSGIGNDNYYVHKIKNFYDLKVHEIELDDEDYNLDSIKKVITNNEELNSDYTYLISEKLSYAAKKKNFIVMLSGMGADELFGGYPRYQLVKYKWFYKKLGKILLLFRDQLRKYSSISKKIDRFFSFIKEDDFIYAYSNLIGSFNLEEIRRLSKNKESILSYHKKIAKYVNKVASASEFKKAFYLDLYGFLSHNFMVADKSSMQASIEMRVPLATKNILMKNFYQPEKKLISFFKTKIQLKNILYKKLPKQIVDRKKTGFNPPLDNLILKLGDKKILQLIQKSSIDQYLDICEIKNIINEHFSGIKNNTYKVWQILYLALWIDHVDRDR